MSYTNFTYSGMKLNTTSEIEDPCEIIGVSVQVQNTGNMDGDEVVQVIFFKIRRNVLPVELRL